MFQHQSAADKFYEATLVEFAQEYRNLKGKTQNDSSRLLLGAMGNILSSF